MNPPHLLLGNIIEYECVSDKDSEDSKEEDIAVAARKEWQAARKANPLSYLDDFWDDFEDKIGWGGDDYENHDDGEISDDEGSVTMKSLFLVIMK